GLLHDEAAALRRDPRIVHWAATLERHVVSQRLWIDGEAIAEQTMHFTVPNLEATAARDGRAQTRTLGGQYNRFYRQCGLAVLRASPTRRSSCSTRRIVPTACATCCCRPTR